MNDSRLFIEIGIEDNNTFVARDKSDYERWINDGHIDEHPHYIFQLLYNVKDGEIEYKTSSSIIEATSLNDFNSDANRFWHIEDVSDGLYYYQKFIIPGTDHAEDQNEHIWYDPTSKKIYFQDTDAEEIIEVSETDAYDYIIRYKPDNCFHFDDYSFSIFALVECYVNIEHERLADFLKNGCAKGCDKHILDLEDRADILLAAINVIRDLMEKEDFFEAQRILEGLSTCNGLCKNYNKKLNPCGCGDS